MTESQGFEQIAHAMQEPLRKFADRVQALAGSNCLAVTVFGAIATPRFDPARHTAKSVGLARRGENQDESQSGEYRGIAPTPNPVVIPQYPRGLGVWEQVPHPRIRGVEWFPSCRVLSVF